MKSLQSRSFFGLSAMIAMLILSSQTATAQMGKIDTSFVSDDSFFVIRIDVKKLVGQVPMGSKDLQMIAKPMKEEAGLDLMNMTAITMQFGSADEGPFDSAFSVTFEHSKAIDREAFHAAREFDLADYTKTEFAEKTYLRNRSDGGPHVYFSNDKTFTMATTKGMESLLKAGSGMGAMSNYLKSSPPGSEIMMAFRSNDGYNEFLDQFFDSLGPIGLPFAPKELLAGAKSGFGHIQLSSSTPIYIQATCDSNDSATKMKGALDQLIEMGKSAVPLGKMMVDAQMKELGDDEFSNMQKSMLSLATDGLKTGQKILDGADTNATEKVVTLKVKQMGGLKELVPLALGGMKSMFMGFQSVGPALRPDAIDAIEKVDEAKEAKRDDRN